MHRTEGRNATDAGAETTVGDLPAKLGVSVSIGLAVNPRAILIAAPHGGIVPGDDLGQLPHALDHIPIVAVFPAREAVCVEVWVDVGRAGDHGKQICKVSEN